VALTSGYGEFSKTSSYILCSVLGSRALTASSISSNWSSSKFGSHLCAFSKAASFRFASPSMFREVENALFSTVMDRLRLWIFCVRLVQKGKINSRYCVKEHCINSVLRLSHLLLLLYSSCVIFRHLFVPMPAGVGCTRGGQNQSLL
jgi:hypothetical protein